MSILNYSSVKDKPSTFRAMTSLNKNEFEKLFIVFKAVLDEEAVQANRDPSKGGRRPKLIDQKDQLLFILFYLKTYPLQEVIGHLFGLSQGQANVWIHKLSGVLKEALQRMGHLPARLSEEMLVRLQGEADQDYGIDATERRIHRPEEEERQVAHYSGKKSPRGEEQCGGGVGG